VFLTINHIYFTPFGYKIKGYFVYFTPFGYKIKGYFGITGKGNKFPKNR